MRREAPAKVNLFLDVLGRRKDGYHELSTLFERIDLCDTLTFGRCADIRLIVDPPTVPSGPDNLVWKAAALLKERHRVRSGVRIRLKKRIPIEAGLGGGSSDAAAALLGLDRFWKLKLTRRQLLSYAAMLGSDVPFFILETPFAYARGRGEKLRPIRARQARFWHVIVKPPFAISTREAFGRLRGVRLTPPRGDVKMRVSAILKGPRPVLAKLLSNSLEAVLNKRLTAISRLKRELTATGALATLMAGSGASVFGIYANRKKAQLARRILLRKHRNWKVFVASTYSERSR